MLLDAAIGAHAVDLVLLRGRTLTDVAPAPLPVPVAPPTPPVAPVTTADQAAIADTPRTSTDAPLAASTGPISGAEPLPAGDTSIPSARIDLATLKASNTPRAPTDFNVQFFEALLAKVEQLVPNHTAAHPHAALDVIGGLLASEAVIAAPIGATSGGWARCVDRLATRTRDNRTCWLDHASGRRAELAEGADLPPSHPYVKEMLEEDKAHGFDHAYYITAQYSTLRWVLKALGDPVLVARAHGWQVWRRSMCRLLQRASRLFLELDHGAEVRRAASGREELPGGPDVALGAVLAAAVHATSGADTDASTRTHVAATVRTAVQGTVALCLGRPNDYLFSETALFADTVGWLVDAFGPGARAALASAESQPGPLLHGQAARLSEHHHRLVLELGVLFYRAKYPRTADSLDDKVLANLAWPVPELFARLTDDASGRFAKGVLCHPKLDPVDMDAVWLHILLVALERSHKAYLLRMTAAWDTIGPRFHRLLPTQAPTIDRRMVACAMVRRHNPAAPVSLMDDSCLDAIPDAQKEDCRWVQVAMALAKACSRAATRGATTTAAAAAATAAAATVPETGAAAGTGAGAGAGAGAAVAMDGVDGVLATVASLTPRDLARLFTVGMAWNCFSGPGRAALRLFYDRARPVHVTPYASHWSSGHGMCQARSGGWRELPHRRPLSGDSRGVRVTNSHDPPYGLQWKADAGEDRGPQEGVALVSDGGVAGDGGAKGDECKSSGSAVDAAAGEPGSLRPGCDEAQGPRSGLWEILPPFSASIQALSALPAAAHVTTIRLMDNPLIFRSPYEVELPE